MRGEVFFPYMTWKDSCFFYPPAFILQVGAEFVYYLPGFVIRKKEVQYMTHCCSKIKSRFFAYLNQMYQSTKKQPGTGSKKAYRDDQQIRNKVLWRNVYGSSLNNLKSCLKEESQGLFSIVPECKAKNNGFILWKSGFWLILGVVSFLNYSFVAFVIMTERGGNPSKIHALSK